VGQFSPGSENIVQKSDRFVNVGTHGKLVVAAPVKQVEKLLDSGLIESCAGSTAFIMCAGCDDMALAIPGAFVARN